MLGKYKKFNAKEYYQKNKDKLKENSKQYYQNNKDKVRERRKRWYKKNKAKINERHKQYNLKNKDKIIERTNQWIQKNKDKRKEYIRMYMKRRRKTDMEFLIECRLRNSLHNVLNYYTKTGKTMTSKKYGINYKAIIQKLTPLPFPMEDRKNYNIDHVRPCSSFDLTNPMEVKKCFSADNLQWLSAKENLSKGSKVLI